MGRRVRTPTTRSTRSPKASAATRVRCRRNGWRARPGIIAERCKAVDIADHDGADSRAARRRSLSRPTTVAAMKPGAVIVDLAGRAGRQRRRHRSSTRSSSRTASRSSAFAQSARAGRGRRQRALRAQRAQLPRAVAQSPRPATSPYPRTTRSSSRYACLRERPGRGEAVKPSPHRRLESRGTS